MQHPNTTISARIRSELDTIAGSLTQDLAERPRENLFIMLVGFSKSGKETLATAHPRLRSMFRVDTDTIQHRLNEAFEFLRDDYSIQGDVFDYRRELTHYVRRRALEQSFKSGVATVLDSTNLGREARAEYLALAREYGYRIVIVWVRCSERTLLKRLRSADVRVAATSGKPSWVSLYQQIQKPILRSQRRRSAISC